MIPVIRGYSINASLRQPHVQPRYSRGFLIPMGMRSFAGAMPCYRCVGHSRETNCAVALILIHYIHRLVVLPGPYFQRFPVGVRLPSLHNATRNFCCWRRLSTPAAAAAVCTCTSGSRACLRHCRRPSQSPARPISGLNEWSPAYLLTTLTLRYGGVKGCVCVFVGGVLHRLPYPWWFRRYMCLGLLRYS